MGFPPYTHFILSNQIAFGLKRENNTQKSNVERFMLVEPLRKALLRTVISALGLSERTESSLPPLSPWFKPQSQTNKQTTMLWE